MDKKLLESKMKLFGDTGGSLAEYLGMNRTTLSLKINEKGAEFTQGEIAEIKQRYSLTAEEVDSIFFNIKVS